MRNPPADFDLLAPGYYDLLPSGESRKAQENGGSIVIHHQSGLGACELAEYGLDVRLAGASAALQQV